MRDYDALVECVKQIKEVTTAVNEKKREVDSLHRLESLEQQVSLSKVCRFQFN